MDYAFYITAVLGALAVYLTMPADRPKPAKLGALLGLAALAGLLVFLLRQTPADARPSLYYYVFTLLAASAAVRVITHPRPVYSALFFVMVVLAVSGLFVVLEAEFMAFAMIIIYAGAILVTYLFVIMLATLPQVPGEEETTPLYDRVAREPFSATLLGFVLLAVLGSVLFQTEGPPKPNEVHPTPLSNAKVVAVEELPGRVLKLVESNRAELVEAELLAKDVEFDGLVVALAPGELHLLNPTATAGEAPVARLPLTTPIEGKTLDAALEAIPTNIDKVGITLFKEHTLGIELAGVILLLSMVGAIVIGRKQVAAEPTAGPEGDPGSSPQPSSLNPQA